MQDSPDHKPDMAAIWLLAVGQTLGFAALLYIFAALVVAWEQATGWSKAQLSLGPTLSILVSAAFAPVMGRLVDRGLGAELLTGGALLGAGALILLSQVQSVTQFVAVWALIGVAHAACLYEVCFAFLTRRLRTGARAAILRVTLLAGFASTIAFPAGTLLAETLGWRAAVLAFAAALALIAVPANLVAGMRLRQGPRAERNTALAGRAEGPSAVRRTLRRPAFWTLAAAFALIAGNHVMLVSYFIPLSIDRGAGQSMAVLAASCVGVAQVAGRLLLTLGEARMGTARASRVMLGALVSAGAVMWLAGVAPVLIFLFAALQGAANGLMSILKPVLTAETLGHEGFGAIAGSMATGVLMGIAAAPVAGALLLDLGGAQALIGVAFAMAVASAILVLSLLAWQRR